MFLPLHLLVLIFCYWFSPSITSYGPLFMFLPLDFYLYLPITFFCPSITGSTPQISGSVRPFPVMGPNPPPVKTSAPPPLADSAPPLTGYVQLNYLKRILSKYKLQLIFFVKGTVPSKVCEIMTYLRTLEIS
jgi:hypothetical protein